MTITSEQVTESMRRAESGESRLNYPAIFAGFKEKGIEEAAIIPRVNVFTYPIWQKKGRRVMKDQHGIKCLTWVISSGKDKITGETYSRKYPQKTTVFHISQTEEI